MGLYVYVEDTAKELWYGSYGGFNRLRDEIAKAAGYAVGTIDFQGKHSNEVSKLVPLPVVDWGHVTHAQTQGQWEEVPDDPLMILLVHSDCDGIIKKEHVGAVASRIEEVIPDIADYPAGEDMADYWREKARRFVAGLRHAAEHQRDVKFV